MPYINLIKISTSYSKSCVNRDKRQFPLTISILCKTIYFLIAIVVVIGVLQGRMEVRITIVIELMTILISISRFIILLRVLLLLLIKYYKTDD